MFVISVVVVVVAVAAAVVAAFHKIFINLTGSLFIEWPLDNNNLHTHNFMPYFTSL